LNAYEARLLGVERQLMLLGRRANTLERETWAGLQDALELWQEIPPAAAPCSGSIDVTVTYAGSPVVGATVTLSGAGGGSGTTNSSGFVSLAIAVAGSYTVTMSAIGCLASASTTITATCTANAITITPATPASRCLIQFTVTGCNSLGVIGATVTATKGSLTVTGTTPGSSGVVTLDVSAGGAGSYSWTASYGPGGLVSTSGTVTVGACGSAAATVATNLTLASGYQCLDVGTGCSVPLPLTIHGSNAYGSFAMTSAGGGGASWVGTQTVSGVSVWTAGCNPGGACKTGSASSGSVTITWRMSTARVASSSYNWCSSTGGNFPMSASGSTSGCNAAAPTMSGVSVNCPPTFLYSATVTDPHAFFTFGTLTITP
jgi:hypothetical protein